MCVWGGGGGGGAKCVKSTAVIGGLANSEKGIQMKNEGSLERQNGLGGRKIAVQLLGHFVLYTVRKFMLCVCHRPQCRLL